MSQKVILVDKKDRFVGYGDSKEAHLGHGRRHRAFVTVLFDSQNRVILQRRKHRLFDGLWDLTAISHPLHLNGRDESYQEASDRALAKEMGIGHVRVKKVGAFNYFAKDGANCENEYCAILVGKYDGQFEPNNNEIYETRQMELSEFIKDIEGKPKIYTPWAQIAAGQLRSLITEGEFKKELAAFLKIFEPYSQKYFKKKIEFSSKYPSLISRFFRDLADFTTGGKRLRAFLVWLGYRVAGGKDVAKILPISLAFELAHSFLLIHDDIIDKSDKRRNKATIHKRYEKLAPSSLRALEDKRHYGQSQALIIGDIACFEAFGLINSSDFENDLKLICYKKLLEVLLETAYGEALDIEYSARRASLEEIWQVIDLKTARYSFVGPLTIGATLGGADKGQLRALSGFGLVAGAAFQLQDDLLGVFGNEKILGKSVLSDLREGKNTVLIFKARKLASSQDRQILDRLWGRRDAKTVDLERIKRIIINSSAKDWCEQKKKKFAEVAKTYITNITGDSSLQGLFDELVDFVIGRKR